MTDTAGCAATDADPACRLRSIKQGHLGRVSDRLTYGLAAMLMRLLKSAVLQMETELGMGFASGHLAWCDLDSFSAQAIG